MNLIQNRRVYESDRHYPRGGRRQYSFLTDIELPQPVAEGMTCWLK
jgi:hypothetical protein